MTKQEMMTTVYNQLAIDYNCKPEDFAKDGVIFTVAKKENGRREMPFFEPRLIKVNSESQLNICIDIIHKSFKTVANNMNLTTENCPGHTAFMPIQRLQSQFKHGVKMFLYKYNNVFVGYFSLSVEENEVELNNLSVLPEYRHRGIGKELINYAMDYSKRTLGASKIKIGIIEENTILKEWYKNFGFTHTAVKKFDHLPFTVGFMELEI